MRFFSSRRLYSRCSGVCCWLGACCWGKMPKFGAAMRTKVRRSCAPEVWQVVRPIRSGRFFRPLHDSCLPIISDTPVDRRAVSANATAPLTYGWYLLNATNNSFASYLESASSSNSLRNNKFYGVLISLWAHSWRLFRVPPMADLRHPELVQTW